MDSILTSIKKLLGVEEKDEDFDVDIIAHINSVLMILTQLGVGPSEGFAIEDKTAKWTDFVPNAQLAKLQAIKSFVHLKVRLLFDPPAGSAVIESTERLLRELEWRINVIAEDTQIDSQEENSK